MQKVMRALIGSLLSALGLIVICGWLLQRPEMVQFRVGLVPMQFNTALCFILTGLALAFPAYTNQSWRKLQTAVGAMLITLCSLTLIEILLNVNLGIDWPSLHTWIRDGNVRPGRMAPNTALGFIVIGAAFIQIPRISNRSHAWRAVILTFSVLAIGLTGLVGYLLGPDLLFGWARSARMAIPTAIGMILAGSALWLSWTHATWYRSTRYFNEDEKIVFMSNGIILVWVLTAGLVGFVAMQIILKQVLHDELQQSYDRRSDLLMDGIQSVWNKVEDLANNTDIVQFILRQQDSSDSAADRTAGSTTDRTANNDFSTLPPTIAQALWQPESRYVALLDTMDRTIVSKGDLAGDGQFSATLATPSSTTLLWNSELRLRIRLPVMKGDDRIGTLVVERSLTLLYRQLFDTRELGDTGEIVICVDFVDYLKCLSKSRSPEVFDVKPYSRYGMPLPIKLAMQGESGVRESMDYRGSNVVAAFGLLAPGVGMVNKTDTYEVYEAVRNQLAIAMPLILLIALLGAALLRSQVRPLARKLMDSETASADKGQQIETLLHTVGEGILTIDESGNIDTFNTAASKIFGYSRDEVKGKNVKILMPPNMRGDHDAGMRRYLSTGDAHIIGENSVEVPGLRADGSTFLIELKVNEVTTKDRRLFVGVVRDITERKKNERELFEEKERLHVTLNSIGDAVITTNTDGAITSLNPVAETMTGWTHAEATGKPLLEVFHIIDEVTGEPALNPVDAVLKSQANAGLAENTILVQRHTGTRFPIEDSAAPIRNKQGEIIGVVLVFHDVSNAKKMAAEMTYQATHDALTGLLNRREFERRIELALATGKIQHKDHTLLYLDLDQFKIVNDTCGHAAGDQLLRQLTARLLQKLRQTDTLGRLGGDEFGVLLDSCPTPAGEKIAEILRQTVSDFHFVWGDKSFPVGVTIGLVTFSNDGLTLTDVLQMADSACYVAKEKGRNRVQVYMPDSHEFSNRLGQMGWVTRITRALEEKRFVLYSQKIVALQQNDPDVVHHEILVRMTDEDGTLIPPMAFIPAAERYGLMSQIDRWVISSAFAYSAVINSQSKERHILAINLSGTTLNDESFFGFVRDLFEASALSPANFCFEITETAAIANLTHAEKLIKDLRALGCSFALDDFGSGMSSFTYLKHLPVDFLKIDGSFVRDMVENPIDKAMVESINHIGHVMGIKTIAEFVENEKIIDLLRNIGVDFAQGYVIQKPEPVFKDV